MFGGLGFGLEEHGIGVGVCGFRVQGMGFRA